MYSFQTTDEGRLVVFGGIPLETDGEIVGTVGSSVGMPEEDVEIARAAVETFGELSE